MNEEMMSDIKIPKGYTPGPWKYSGITEWDDGHGWYIHLPTRTPRKISVEGGSAAEADANARLIASAPDMATELTALRGEVEKLRAFANAFGQSSMYYPNCGCHVCEKYRAALSPPPAVEEGEDGNI